MPPAVPPAVPPAGPQHPAEADETVRMPADGASGRTGSDKPPVTGTGTVAPPAAAPVHAQAAAQSAPPAGDRAQHPSQHPSTGRAGDPAAEPGDPAVDQPVDTTDDGTTADSATDDTRPVTRDWLRGGPDRAAQADTGRSTPQDGETAGLQDADAHPTAPVGTPPPRPGAQPDASPDAAGPRSPGEPPTTGGTPGGGTPGGDRRRSWWRRTAVLVPAAVVGLLAAAYGTDLLVSSGEIPRSTVVAGVDIGGLSPVDAATALERDLAPRVAADHTVVADDVEATLSPTAAGIALDVDGTVDAAAEQPLNPWSRLTSFFGERTVVPEITGDETALAAQLETVAAQVDRAPVDATIALEGTTPSLVEPADGRTLDREGAAEAVTDALASGGDPATPIELPVEMTPVRVDTAEARRVLEETVTPALAAPVTVTSADGATSAEVPVEAVAASLTFTPQDDGELAVGVDPAALQESLGDALGVFGTPPEDARFEISGDAVSVVPSVEGTGVDPAQLAEQLLGVLPDPAPRTVTAELGTVPAELTTEEAEALGIVEKVSSFTTNFTNAASGTNIRVVAEEVDGALVLPGETFSLNTFTGPRGTAQGYVPAAVISGGELSTAVGGGISQFATTMFNAVFFAGLEDVYHKPHSFYISRYPAGREATVYEGAIDLVWRNDSDTGVLIDTEWVPGAITVTFYGTKRYEIQSVSSDRTNLREPTVMDRVDDGDCTPQGGIPGFDITVTRIFRDLQSGAEIRRENFSTSYAAEAVINCIPPEAAPAPGEESTPPSSPSPGG